MKLDWRQNTLRHYNLVSEGKINGIAYRFDIKRGNNVWHLEITRYNCDGKRFSDLYCSTNFRSIKKAKERAEFIVDMWDTKIGSLVRK